MRIYKIYFFIISFVVFSGCIYDDLSNCPVEGNFALSFYYLGDGLKDIFPERIENVEVYIFNEHGEYIFHEKLTHERLNIFQGIDLILNEGNYQVVCWGNVRENTYITSVSDNKHISDFRLFHPNYIKQESIATFDSLYYASRSIRINKSEIQNAAVAFSSAHILLEVYVEGFSERTGNTEKPVIKLNNIFSGYDFDMALYGNTDFFPAVQTDQTGKIHLAMSELPRFMNDNNITIEVEGSSQSLFTLNLKEFMSENKIVVEGIHEVVIPVYIRFTVHGVSVSVAKWDQVGNVKPSF